MPRLTKILGFVWNKELDVFIFDFDEIYKQVNNPPTKRNVLQLLASIYDPIGLRNKSNCHPHESIITRYLCC